MEMEQRIDERASAIRNCKEEMGSVQEEGIDVQGRGTPIRNRKDQAEAQQGGIDGERTKRKLAIGNRKEGRFERI
jgi:hypothetical protein